MKCPFCQTHEDKVIDSRVVKEGEAIRRRRECIECSGRFTTYEYVESTTRTVVKRDGSREDFDRKKLVDGFRIACSKRPISYDQIQTAVDKLIDQLQSEHSKEISADHIGELVMSSLKNLDEVAFVRFASVYRKFEVVADFVKEIQSFDDPKDK